MKGTFVAIALALCGTASAKPLPAGMKIAVVKGQVKVSQGGATVPLFDDLRYPVTKVVSSKLSDDGKSLEVQIDACDDMFSDSTGPHVVELAPVQARLENAIGMGFHMKKKYADAIKHFTAAVAASAEPVYVTNLLSAQAMGGKLEDADQTLATYGKKLAPWIAWRLAVDSDLKALVGRPSAKLGDKPGKATSKLDKEIAVSPLGFAATEVSSDAGFENGPGGDYSTDIVFIELATSNEVLRLPAETYCDDSGMDGSTPKQIKQCKQKHAAAAVKTRKVADAVLATLGFEVAKNAHRDPKSDEAIKTPEGKAFDLGKVQDADEALSDAWDLWFVPKFTVYEIRHKIVSDCSGTGDLHMTLEARAR